MRLIARCGQVVGLLVATMLGGGAYAQTTDAYHSIQVFPVVVDTASFAQRFTFKNPNPVAITIQPTYFPATGTSQATSINCPTFIIAAGMAATITSLRTMCPSLASGSQFGFLHTALSGGGYLPYAGFSRVSNPQGNGFSVEAFSAMGFTAADLVVNGIRRLAAAGGQPAFQTNCFVGIINNLDSSLPLNSTNIHYTLYNSAGTQIGQGDVALLPGKIVRLLDVFLAGGVAPGDQDNAQIKFEEQGPDEPGVMAFCTVQDNTSFGADFRVAKQEIGDGGAGFPGRVVGPQSNFENREILISSDPLGRPFEIAAGNSANTHLVYTHYPDFGFCEIINPNTGVRALPAYGLEIRSTNSSEATGQGGNNSTIVPDPGLGQGNYFGDKADGGDGNERPSIIEVESNEQNTGQVRPYKLHCRTGSGMTMLDIIRYKEAVDRF